MVDYIQPFLFQLHWRIGTKNHFNENGNLVHVMFGQSHKVCKPHYSHEISLDTNEKTTVSSLKTSVVVLWQAQCL